MSEVSQAIAWHDPYSPLIYIDELVSHLQLEFANYSKEILEHLLIAGSLYIVLCIILSIAVLKWKILNFNKHVQNHERVLIVTAHPDDECMFFGPTIMNFTKAENTSVYLLCLSSGSNYGMDGVRKEELYKSCRILGIPNSNIVVINHEELPDDIHKRWPEESVASLILHQIEIYDITTVVTFDRNGISSHPNHCSIYYAIAHLSIGKQVPKRCKVYVLETVSLFRKYSFFLDILLSFLLSRTRYIVGSHDRAAIREAMAQHKSQLVWFRKLYLIFSRYIVINTLQEMNTADIELDLSIDD